MPAWVVLSAFAGNIAPTMIEAINKIGFAVAPYQRCGTSHVDRDMQPLDKPLYGHAAVRPGAPRDAATIAAEGPFRVLESV